jgi:hypothetical protein
MDTNNAETDLKLFLEPGEHFATQFFKSHVAFTESPIDACDYVISTRFPMGLVKKSELQSILNTYKGLDKKVIAFLISDFDGVLNVPGNVLLFRTSLYKSKKKENEILLPYIWEGFKESFYALPKGEKPIVGFCGSIKKNLGRRLSSIQAFENNQAVQSNFILRHSFWGGKPHDTDLKNDFLNNIKESHFTISNRGAGNFSMRFYQVLSLGRIPVLLNTDMVFPFENEIQWNKYIVTARNEEELVLNALDFWEKRSEEELALVQQECWSLYDTYFKPASFGVKINALLQQYRTTAFASEKKQPQWKAWFGLSK